MLIIFCISAGEIPKGALYVGLNERIEGGYRHTDQFYLVPVNHEAGDNNSNEADKPVTDNSKLPTENSRGALNGVHSHDQTTTPKESHSQQKYALNKVKVWKVFCNGR